MVFDVLVKNGHVVDGTGNPWFQADVGIEKGKIRGIGRLREEAAKRVIDAKGLIVCPGFLDVHSHAERGVFDDPWANNMVRQGITMFLGGHCGSSPAPTPGRVIQERTFAGGKCFKTFKEFFNAIESQGFALNISTLVGHGTLRNYVMGFDLRDPTEAELKEMKMLVAKAMEDGVFGLSTGLAYAPGFYANTEEVIELCKVVARYGGFYATHIRFDSKEKFLPAVKEAIEIGEKSGCPVQLSHIETHYDGWGLEGDAVKLIDEARERGLPVLCDTCTMVLGYGSLATLPPKWVFEGGPEKFKERLSDRATRKKIKEDIIKDRDHVSRCIAADGRWDLMYIVESGMYPDYVGKTLADFIKYKGEDPWDVVFDLIVEGPPRNRSISHNEDDIRIVLKHPTCAVECDAGIIRFPKEPDKVKWGIHPRGIITFPMIFRKYVRGETRKDLLLDEGTKLLSLEEAVRKMTSLPAQSMGLFDRGLIREGMWADIVIFDKDRIRDTSTYEYVYQYPEGIEYVLVNGEVVIEKGEHTGALPGKVVRAR